MRITTVLMFTACLQAHAKGLAQKVTLSEKNAPLPKIFKQIKAQTGYVFFYDETLMDKAKPVTVRLQSAPLETALDSCFSGQPLSYSIVGNNIVVKEKEAPKKEPAPPVPQGFMPPPASEIHGRVVDSTGAPLDGASVTIKGTKHGTQTDAQGKFSLNYSESDITLIASFTGFQPTTLTPGSDNNVLIILHPSNSILDQVQVIAYGTQTQRFGVGNVTTIKGEDIAKHPVQNPLVALEGQVPGLFITQSNGVPGGAATIRIQGQNSIQNGNDPLYVIDGVPYVSQTLPTANIGGQAFGFATDPNGGAGNPMNYINPNDIESISILKDADATAIYGSRAANGAILITTKKGTTGPARLDVGLQQGWGKVTRTVDVMNEKQYLAMRHEARKNDGLDPYPSYTDPSNSDWDINGLWDTTRDINWQKSLIGGTAKYTNVNVSTAGGSPNIQYLVGATYNKQTTVFPGDFSDQKGSVHFNLNTQSSNQKFTMQFSGSYLYDDNELPYQDLTTSALALAPDAPELFKVDGSINWQPTPAGYSSWSNPATYIFQRYQNKTSNLISSLLLKYNILQGLNVQVSAGYNSLQTNEFSGVPFTSVDPYRLTYSTEANLRSAKYSTATVNSWIVEPQLSYKRVFGQGRLEALVGATVNQVRSNGQSYGESGFLSDALLTDPASGANRYPNPSVQSIYKYDAVFGRINYNYQDKYIVDLNGRRDGSSRFGPSNLFHDFGAVGAGWIFSEEKFIKNSLKFLSYGKLKGSYGTTGNDKIGDYQFLNLYRTNNASYLPYQGVSGLAPTGLPNPYLQWEESRKLQAGIELGFIKNRLLFNINYVKNRSSNQLVNQSLPATAGFPYITENWPAIVQNTAWELAVNTINVKSRQFSWNSSINLTIPNNKLVSYSGTVPGYLYIGKPLGTQKLYHFMGVDPATGVYQFEDSHGKPTLNPDFSTDANVYISANLPKWYGGVTNTFQFKNFTLDFLFQFVKHVLPSNAIGAFMPGLENVNQPASLTTRWQKTGDITNVQRYNTDFSVFGSYSNAAYSSDAAFSDASFIRLRNLSLSYQLPAGWIQKAHIKTASLYVQGENLLTITSYKGMDPETGSNSLPPLRMLTIGVRAGL